MNATESIDLPQTDFHGNGSRLVFLTSGIGHFLLNAILLLLHWPGISAELSFILLGAALSKLVNKVPLPRV